jgi:DNA (cytosine-5)-methyltransferase 1
MKYLSVCSGIEAASVAWEKLGWKPVAFSEIEPFPSAVLNHHWPEVPNLGDMTKYESWKFEEAIDVLVGGTPCQAFSVAGLRKGLADPRGGLSLTFVNIADHFNPKWILWENVPGVLSSRDNGFGCFLGALAGEDGELKPPGEKWADAGCVYGPKRSIAWRCLDAQYFGVAQRRKRCFLVACPRDQGDPAKVLFEWEGLRRDTAPSREARKGIASNAEGSIDAGCVGAIDTECEGGKLTNQTVRAGHILPSIVSPTITQCKGSRGGCSSEAISEITAVQQATAFRMQAFGEYSDDGSASTMKARDYKDATDLVASPIVIDRAAFNQGQNAQYKPHIAHSETMDSLVARGPHAVAIPIHDQATRNAGKRGDKQDGKGNGLGIGKPGDPCPTLTKGDKHAVLYENHPNDSRVTGPLDVAPSCVSRYGTGGGNVPLVQEAIAFEPGIASREGNESRFVKEMSPTLRKDMGDNQVAVAVDTYNQALQKVAIPIRSTASDICHTGGVINPADRLAVRRLTPKECERLQGFPDEHTLIPWRGKPADQCPDGPRYKALGNSMAVPCMEWIGNKIKEASICG